MSKMIFRPLILVGAVLSTCTFAAGNPVTSYMKPDCRTDRALFPAVNVAINVEVADDPQERAKGLMGRKDLAAYSGMLFIYEQPQRVSFWMKNTLIPLDIIFMDRQGVIRHIAPMAIPLDLTSIPGNLANDPRPDRLMVLEIAGGEATRLGLKKGMAMAYPRLNQLIAALPCQ